MQHGIVISCSDPRLEDAPMRARVAVRSLGYAVEDNATFRVQIAGPDGDCSGALGIESQNEALEKIGKIVALNRAKFIVIIGHCDCAGNNCPDDTHHEHTKMAAEILHKRYQMPVIGFLDCPTDGGKWQLELVCHLEQA